jgi:hypothetical protein
MTVPSRDLHAAGRTLVRPLRRRDNPMGNRPLGDRQDNGLEQEPHPRQEDPPHPANPGQQAPGQRPGEQPRQDPGSGPDREPDRRPQQV